MDPNDADDKAKSGAIEETLSALRRAARALEAALREAARLGRKDHSDRIVA